MPLPQLRVFFDTSVYIAALISPEGAAGELVKLAEGGAIVMVVCEEVVREADRVLGRKFPELMQESRRLWKNIGPEVSPDPQVTEVEMFSKLLPAGDASILCAALHTNVVAFVTWNTCDFMKPGISDLVRFPVLIPEDCLKLIRERLDAYLD